MGQVFGIEVRTTRQSSWTQCRQRGGSLAVGYLAMLDLAGSDALTSSDADEGAKQNPGTRTAASSQFATVIPATAGLTHGRLGVVMDRTALDDGLGLYELGEDGSGGVSPVLVPRALVLVDAASVAGAALQVQSGSTFAPSGGGATFAILLDDCTTDDGAGPSATLNYRRVILYSDGLASYAVAGVLPANSVSNAELRDSAALSLIGRASNTLGDPADILVDADGDVVHRDGTALVSAPLPAKSLATGAAAAALARDGDLSRAAFADAAGMTFPRTAALFLPGIAGSRQRCSFSFDPTNTTDITYRFKRRGLSRQAVDTFWFGTSGADRPILCFNYTAPSTWAVEMRETNTALLSYTWTDDLEEHEWTFAYSSTGCVMSLDGAVVASGVTAPSFASTSFTQSLGVSDTSSGSFGSDHAIYRDFEVIDPATATNKVYLRLDEPAGGPYRNAYLNPGDALYDATNTSGVTIATTGTATQYPSAVTVQTVNGGDRPAPARRLLERTRVAAYSGLGDHAAAGQFGLVSWAPTGTPNFRLGVKFARSISQGNTLLVGSGTTDTANIWISATGNLELRSGASASSVLVSCPIASASDNRVREALGVIRQVGADIYGELYLDNRFVGSGTIAGRTLTTVAANYTVGGFAASRRWSGTIFDVLIEDLNSAANSGYYLMDEARGSTTYANSYSGGTLAGLTINGFVSSCQVASSDGRGRSWQPGDGGAFRYGARLLADAAGITGVTSYTIAGLTEDERDPTGHYAAGVFTAPCAGVATFTVHAGIAATTLAGADDITLNVTATSGDVYSAKGTLHTVNVYVPFTAHGIAVLAAGDTLTAAFDSLLVGDVYTIALGAAFHIDFTPTPAAG